MIGLLQAPDRGVDLLVQSLNVLLPCGYLFVAMLFAMAFAGGAEPRISRLRRPLLWILTVLHVGLFVVHGRAIGGFPKFDGWLNVSAVALATVVLFVLVTLRRPQPTVGAIVLLTTGVLQMIASMFGSMTPVPAEQPVSAATAAHVVTASLASASVVLSGLYGFLYLLLLRQMKRQTFGALFQRLPDLTQLAFMTRRAALVGFIGLALGVNVGIGIGHAKNVSDFAYLDPTTLLILGVWVHFGLIAFSRRIRGITAQRASWAAVGGFTVLLGALFLLLVPGATFHALR